MSNASPKETELEHVGSIWITFALVGSISGLIIGMLSWTIIGVPTDLAIMIGSGLGAAMGAVAAMVPFVRRVVHVVMNAVMVASWFS